MYECEHATAVTLKCDSCFTANTLQLTSQKILMKLSTCSSTNFCTSLICPFLTFHIKLVILRTEFPFFWKVVCMQGSFRLQNETGSNLSKNVRGVHYELFHWVQFRSIQPMKQSFTNDSGVLLCRTLNCRLLVSRCDLFYSTTYHQRHKLLSASCWRNRILQIDNIIDKEIKR